MFWDYISMERDPTDLTTHPSLLLRLRDIRDQQAWALFVEVYGPLIFSYCLRKRMQESDAADISQEVLAGLATSLRGFEYQPERGRFRQWLGTVTHREMLRFWRRKKAARMQTNVEPEQIEAVEDPDAWDYHFHSEIMQLALRRIQNEFENETWQIFEQLWLADKSPEEVARSFQTRIGSVYVAKSRVLKRLRAEVVMLSDDLPLQERSESTPIFAQKRNESNLPNR